MFQLIFFVYFNYLKFLAELRRINELNNSVNYILSISYELHYRHLTDNKPENFTDCVILDR